MELARMFATLGFKVDQTGLKGFEDALRNLRGSAAKLSSNLRSVGTQLDSVKKKVTALNAALNQDTKTKKLGSNTQESYSRLAKYVERVNDAHEGVSKHAPKLIESLSNIRAAVHKGANAWERYAKAIGSAKEDMRTFKQSVSDLRRGTGSVNVRNQYYGGNTTTRSPFPPTQQPQDPTTSMMLMGGIGGARNFFRSMTPATALAGGAASAGFAVKEVVQSGREVHKMRQALLVATEEANNNARALAYVDREAKRLGVSYVEMGQAYAKATIAVGGKLSTTQLEKMMSSVSELIVTLGLSTDDQKGVYRAMTQMFAKEKISLEEVNQMAERGIPAYKMMKAAAMEYYKVDNDGFKKMIQKGEIITKEVFPLMAEQMGVMARKGGALDKAINSDIAAQQRLKNAWDKFSYTLMNSGLAKGLAMIFEGLTVVVEGMDNLVLGFKEATKGVKAFIKPFKDLASEFPIMAAVITTVVLALSAFALGLSTTAIRLGIATVAAKVFNAVMIVLRSTIFRVFLVLGLLYKLFNDFNDSFNKGQDNWVTYLSVQFELLFAYIDLASSKLMYFYSLVKLLAKNPIKIGGDIVDNVTSEVSLKGIGQAALGRMKQNFTDIAVGVTTQANKWVNPPSEGKNSSSETTVNLKLNDKQVGKIPLDGATHKVSQ